MVQKTYQEEASLARVRYIMEFTTLKHETK